ncbi:histone deacetylase clr3 [Podospora fimiseda]|uniref:Histone deacetylase n=1 Tax=Podospora fimiseda TaxID=252190 RepID=A0AAN7BRZ8_9PEZI|nr:histone deacetylase clr3 [Podospora fimiseda]
MEDNDQDIVMEGVPEMMMMLEGPPSANGFLHRAVTDSSFETPTPNGPSADGTGEDTGATGEGDSQTSDPLAYPRIHIRRGLLPTGCCYDDRMKLHANADFGPNPHHPEDPSRIEHIMRAFKQNGLVFTGNDEELLHIIQTSPNKYMWRIPAREATKEEICTVHHPSHYIWVEELSRKSTTELRRISNKLDQGRDSLYVGSMTYEASLISAGGAIETCKAVVAGTVKNAFAVIRPPGHHAEFDAAMGFCLFNNVPIAAKVCQQDFPNICRKILILDWDVHHGNGIQNMFWEDPNILYISLHVYKNGEFYPGKPDNPMVADGGLDQCGAGAGIGKNINIGWHDQGMGDGEYMAAFQKIVMPIAHEFSPDLVIISAGFDAAAGDELGACFVSPGCYAHMTHMLMSLAGGKVAVCLEGGYDLEAISKSALAVAQTLMGESPPKMEIPKISKEAAKVLAKVQAYQAPYWECMRPGVVDVQEMRAQDSARLHDVVRLAQRQRLFDKYGMLPLFIQRDVLFKSFENQVLVTRGIIGAKKMLVIIHDPPVLHGQPDPLDNSLESHNTWVTDGVSRYIDWAISQGFGVMDINVPHYISRPEDNDAYTPRSDEAVLHAQLRELTGYLWDNYLQLYDVQDLFLMGIGNAYLGVKTLLINRNSKGRIAGIVNFVDGSLRPVKSDVDEYLSGWYKENSQVYVANDHLCWSDPDLTRKVMKRRFGTAIRSPVNGLTMMMAEHMKDVQSWISERVARREALRRMEEEDMEPEEQVEESINTDINNTNNDNNHIDNNNGDGQL